jgi:hypothetical protein
MSEQITIVAGNARGLTLSMRTICSNVVAGFMGRSLNCWTRYLLAVLAIAGAAVPMPQIAAAAPPSIDPTSCGGPAAAPVPNSYCSFEEHGEDVAIDYDSCNVVNACRFLGNGTRIGHDSCNGSYACYYAGYSGSSSVGDRACNGERACAAAGYSGGSGSVSDNACNGKQACYYLGANYGSSSVGDSSCKGDNACYQAGYSGGSIIGERSCNDTEACLNVGAGGENSIIGNNQLNN